jgi:hypothetical protein
MKIAREFELRLERLVDGISATLFRGRMHPVDLANRLIRYVDLNVAEGTAGPEIANHYAVRVNPAELDPDVDEVRLTTVLEKALTATAEEQGWRIGGPVTVEIVPDTRVTQGSIRCDPDHIAGSLPPWCLLIDTGGAEVHEIGDNRVLVGRAADVDVRIDHARVSRHHALVYRAAGMMWTQDLGSANGTQLNGEPVAGKPMQMRPGDVVSFGPATFSVRLT